MSGCAGRHPALIAHYEQLRGDVLRRGIPGRGLALFLRQGMMAWIGAWTECATDLSRPSPSPLAAPLPTEVRSQLTLILASMLTRPIQERRP